MKPLVAVPAGIGEAGKVARIEVAFAGRRYLAAIEQAGAIPVVLPPEALSDAEAAHLLGRFDAMVLLGGPDVAPQAYGQEPHPSVYGVNIERDRFEMHMVRAAVALELPTLAICRGMQVANVALGGTLIQHLGDVEGLTVDHAPHGFPAPPEGVLHEVELEPGSRIAKAMGSERVVGASYHHQALDRLADGLVVTGRSADGIIEAVEHERGWFVATQWHPEDTVPTDQAQRDLFRGLIDATR